jgi:predicted nuclease of predicted toxin-antitoxin system
MRFLANENFPLTSVKLIRSSGYDIISITETSPGIKDEEVLELAVNEQRIILTFDRDYGELIYRLRKPTPKGVVYFRYAPLTPEQPAQDLLVLLNVENLSLEQKFTVVESNQVRQRSLPQC